jgi:glycosyltransferase involved in cell wall biosynthesis
MSEGFNPGLRVSFIAEQLMQEIPGGIGTYVRAMLRRVPFEGVELDPVVARHRTNALANAGLSHARTLNLPRQLMYQRWMSGHGPTLGGPAAIVHAPSMAFPPHDGRPLIVTVHDIIFRTHPGAYPEKGVEFHEAMLSRINEADVVVVPSKATADALSSLDDPPSDVRIIPMGTDMQPPPEQERQAMLERLRVERPYVLWMGTLEPRKNPEGVMRGFVHAIDTGVPDADKLNLYLVGPPGWWSGDVRELIESKGLADRVRRIDAQPVPVRAALYAEASAFVFPSFAEGFGLPLLEAMACGTPVITSNVSSLPEVAGSAAELCDPKDHVSIGNAISKVLRDSDLADDLRRLGLRRAAEFSWDRTARSTAALYRELLDTKVSASA